jgi:hypothetical protein
MRISFYNENSARNALRIDINDVTFYFSYNTLVAVHLPYSSTGSYRGTYTVKNYW